MPIIDGQDPAALQHAAEQLAAGHLVAFATETVYGLGARADDEAAVARIFAAKGRPADHPVIVHLAEVHAVDLFSETISAGAHRLMAAYWPGPLTLILPRRSGMAAAAAGRQDSIGLRMPAHPVAHALLQHAARLGVPGVAAPSANRFGRVSPTTAAHVAAEFSPDLLVLDGGACPVGIESAIVDCTREQPALLRPGQLSRRQLELVLGQPLAAPDTASPRASGTLASHYAPQARLELVGTPTLRLWLAGLPPGPGDRVAVYSRLAPVAGQGWIWRRMPSQAAATAHELFAVLRELDAAGVGTIWVEQPPSDPDWDGVRDRLQRAAA